MSGIFPRNYDPIEIGIAGRKFTDSIESERICEGDVVEIRKPLSAIGFKEANLFIWILIENLEWFESNKYKDQSYDVSNPDLEFAQRFDKRRYMIPLQHLKTIVPEFDIDRARNPNDIYQPFRILDLNNFRWIIDNDPIAVEGLIFDKILGKFVP